MSNPWINRKPHLPPSPRLAAGLLFGLSLTINSAVAETAAPTSPPATVSPGVRALLSAGSTVTGEPIQYPSGAAAEITAEEITLAPGQQTGWHTHPIPLFGYILAGELTVDYGTRGTRIYRTGEGFAEAVNEAHNGHNRGEHPVKILAVYIGMKGVQESAPASPPAH